MKQLQKICKEQNWNLHAITVDRHKAYVITSPWDEDWTGKVHKGENEVFEIYPEWTRRNNMRKTWVVNQHKGPIKYDIPPNGLYRAIKSMV